MKTPPPTLRPASPLAELNAHLARVSEAARGPQAVGDPGPWPDLRSARRFRETWERLAAEMALDQASERAPENAGPLNAHMLVLKTLGLMRELSPDYLRRFLSHADALMWLDQSFGQIRSAPARAAGKVPAKGAAKPAGKTVRVRR
jgi:hypothetical protein